MDDRMEPRAPWMPWALGGLILILVVVGAYSFGAAHAGAAGGADGARPHWFGFPFFGLFVLFWLLAPLRWGWGGCYRPWRYRRYYGPRYYRDDGPGGPWHEGPGAWEEWHRREHEKMDPHAEDSHRR